MLQESSSFNLLTSRISFFPLNTESKFKYTLLSNPRTLRFEIKSEKSIEIFAHSEYSSYIWTFGKHKGIPIGLIPKSYLEWVSGEEFIPTYQSAIEAKEIAIKFLNK